MEFDGAREYVYCAERWNSALDKANDALVDLRAIFPLHTHHLTETGSRAIDSAMDHIKDGIVDLHRAGRHILGSEQYDDFIEERAYNNIAQREEI